MFFVCKMQRKLVFLIKIRSAGFKTNFAIVNATKKKLNPPLRWMHTYITWMKEFHMQVSIHNSSMHTDMSHNTFATTNAYELTPSHWAYTQPRQCHLLLSTFFSTISPHPLNHGKLICNVDNKQGVKIYFSATWHKWFVDTFACRHNFYYAMLCYAMYGM